MAMRRFHLVIHARPPALTGNSRLQVHPCQLSQPLPFSFEETCERLALLPRMFCEPDGSFVWVGETNTTPSAAWQIDGNLADGPVGLMTVELKGHASWEELQQLFSCFSAAPENLIFQFVHEAIFLDAAALKFWLSNSDNLKQLR